MAGAGELISTRRGALAMIAAGLLLPGCVTRERGMEAGALSALERRAGGRLGVFVLDAATGHGFGHRADERFGLCSTFKLPLAAFLLKEVDAGTLRADEILHYSAADMVPHAPVTEKHLETGLSLVALAEAAQVTSDNVAANLLLKRLGGPAAFTAWLRASGDTVTRLDRYEPELNLVPPGELRDTTTPRAMAGLAATLFGPALLSPQSCTRLAAWTVRTESGLERIRAGLPSDWRAGDKTGTAEADGMADKVNDVAIAWPEADRGPFIITAYYDAPTAGAASVDEKQSVLAEAGRIAAGWLAAQTR